MQDRGGLKSESVDLIHVSRRQWLGFGFAFVILWSVALYLWFQIGLDRTILFSMNYTNVSANLFVFARLFTGYGMSAIVYIYLCYLLLSFRNSDLRTGRQIFLLIIFSFAPPAELCYLADAVPVTLDGQRVIDLCLPRSGRRRKI